jgi:hypothetical protein
MLGCGDFCGVVNKRPWNKIEVEAIQKKKGARAIRLAPLFVSVVRGFRELLINKPAQLHADRKTNSDKGREHRR